jgi:hypothetical protein
MALDVEKVLAGLVEHQHHVIPLFTVIIQAKAGLVFENLNASCQILKCNLPPPPPLSCQHPFTEIEMFQNEGYIYI